MLVVFLDITFVWARAAAEQQKNIRCAYLWNQEFIKECFIDVQSVSVSFGSKNSNCDLADENVRPASLPSLKTQAPLHSVS